MTILCELYPGICLTTEEKARKNLSQGLTRARSCVIVKVNLEYLRMSHNNFVLRVTQIEEDFPNLYSLNKY